jgi:hypothetical protein
MVMQLKSNPSEPNSSPPKPADQATPKASPDNRPLSPAAQRALAEAAARRAEHEPSPGDQAKTITKEIGGRDGPEPTRYSDWEINGLTSDF